MKTKVIVCGNINCVNNCTISGTCIQNKISIDKDGKCILFRNKNSKRPTLPVANEMDEHTNMC